MTVSGPKFSPYFPDGVQANGWVGNFTLHQTEVGAQLNNPYSKPPLLQPFTVSGTPGKGSNLLFMGTAMQTNAPRISGAGMYVFRPILLLDEMSPAILPPSFLSPFVCMCMWFTHSRSACPHIGTTRYLLGNNIQQPVDSEIPKCLDHDPGSYPEGTCVVPDSADTVSAWAQARIAHDHLLVLGLWDVQIHYPWLVPPHKQ